MRIVDLHGQRLAPDAWLARARVSCLRLSLQLRRGSTARAEGEPGGTASNSLAGTRRAHELRDRHRKRGAKSQDGLLIVVGGVRNAAIRQRGGPVGFDPSPSVIDGLCPFGVVLPNEMTVLNDRAVASRVAPALSMLRYSPVESISKAEATAPSEATSLVSAATRLLAFQRTEE